VWSGVVWCGVLCLVFGCPRYLALGKRPRVDLRREVT